MYANQILVTTHMLKRGRRSFQRSVSAQMQTPPKVLLLLLLAPSFEAFYNSHPDENRELPNLKQEERTSRNSCLEVMSFRTPGQEPFKILLTLLRCSKPNHLHPHGLFCCQKRNCKENQSMNSSRLVSDGSMKMFTRLRRLKPWKVQRLLRLIKRTGEDINNNNNKQDQILKTKFVTSLAKRTSEDSSNNLEQTMKKKYTTRLGKRTTGDKSIYSNTSNLEAIMKKQYSSRLGKRTPGEHRELQMLKRITEELSMMKKRMERFRMMGKKAIMLRMG